MKIAQSAIFMTSGHQKKEKYSRTENLEAWAGAPPAAQPADRINLTMGLSSDLSAAASRAEDSYYNNTIENQYMDGLTPDIWLIKQIIEKFLGRELKMIKNSDLNSSPSANVNAIQYSVDHNAPQGWGVRYDSQESYTESEQTSVAMQGIVRTADGKEISFNLSVQMSRSYMEQNSTSLRLGDAKRKIDPLVINFGGTEAKLSDWKFNFDLNADGVKESIPFVTQGSGIIVFDKNGDRQVNDGKELFGPSTGNGFAELAALDENKNGWIDENDSAYSQLAVWKRDQAGNESLISLNNSNVGALNIGYVSTPFDLKDETNNLHGQIIGTGVYLSNAGNAGTIQQLDITL